MRCKQNACKSGRIPCNREECRNAPPPRIFYWWDVAVAAVEDFFYCYRVARCRHGRIRSLWVAFDAAFIPTKPVARDVPGMPITMEETSDWVMAGVQLLCAVVGLSLLALGSWTIYQGWTG